MAHNGAPLRTPSLSYTTPYASLAGTLTVTTGPSAGSGPFTILTAASRTGAFATVSYSGGSHQIQYTPTSVTLDAAPTAVRLRSFTVGLDGSTRFVGQVRI